MPIAAAEVEATVAAATASPGAAGAIAGATTPAAEAPARARGGKDALPAATALAPTARSDGAVAVEDRAPAARKAIRKTARNGATPAARHGATPAATARTGLRGGAGAGAGATSREGPICRASPRFSDAKTSAFGARVTILVTRGRSPARFSLILADAARHALC